MKKSLYFFSILLCLSFFSGCNRINDGIQDKKERFMRKNAVIVQKSLQNEIKEKELAFEKYLSSVSLHDKVSQLFIENLEGDTAFFPVEKDFIPGGYIFFGYNVASSPKKIIGFTDSIKKYCAEHKNIPPFLAVDQEGGTVNRLKVVAGPLSSAEKVSSVLTVKDAYELYKTQAKQMKALGFDMNLAPVVEIKTPKNENFLQGRSFGSLKNVQNYGSAFINAFENNGIATVLKHFPGNTNTDPHTGLPEISLTDKELTESLKPFFILNRRNPTATLMSHARVKSKDNGKPSCFSEYWISDVLRKTIGFTGLVMSDDVFMAALSKNGFPPKEAAVKALQAGVNVIMISEKRISSEAKNLIKKAEEDSSFRVLIENSFKKVMEYKLKANIISFNKEDNGEYKMVPVVSQKSIADRLLDFDNARNENINIYIEEIDSAGNFDN